MNAHKKLLVRAAGRIIVFVAATAAYKFIFHWSGIHAAILGLCITYISDPLVQWVIEE